MRLNLGCGDDIRVGYINIDCKSLNVSGEFFRQGDMESLDWLTENDTVDEILAIDCLEYLTNIDSVKKAIANWFAKLKIGGKITILIPDCYVVAQSFVQGQIDLGEFTKIILGADQEHDRRNVIIDSDTILRILSELGLVITTKRYEGIAMYIEVQKC